MSKVGKPGAFEGGRGYYPDLSGQRRANLNHIEKYVGKIGRKPTFDKAMAKMVEDYGPFPAMMLIPMVMTIPGLLDNSIGAQVEIGDFGHENTALHNHVDGVTHIYTDVGQVKAGQESFFIVDHPVNTDNPGNDRAVESNVVFDQYSFNDGTQYYHAGDAGFFMVFNPSPEISKVQLSFGNQVPAEMRDRLHGELGLFDLSSSALNATPINDESGVSGFEVIRGGVSPDSLKLLLTNHSARRGSATDRAIERAAANGGGQIDLMIRVEESTDVQGKPEKVVKFFALGQDSVSLLATKEVHPGGISLPAGTPKDAMLSRFVSAGEQTLLVTPAFPDGTPDGYIVWSDETGAVFAGEGYGDKKLLLESQDNELDAWVEVGKSVVINGVEFQLEDVADENGFSKVTDWQIDDESLSDIQKSGHLAPFEVINSLGFADDVDLLYNAETQELHVVLVGDHTTVVGEWNEGSREIVWEGGAMVPLLFGEGGAKITEMRGVNPIDREQAREDAVRLQTFSNTYHGGKYNDAIFLYGPEGKSEAIVAFLESDGTENLNTNLAESGEVDGTIFLLSASGENVRMKVNNLPFTIRYTRTFN